MVEKPHPPTIRKTLEYILDPSPINLDSFSIEERSKLGYPTWTDTEICAFSKEIWLALLTYIVPGLISIAGSIGLFKDSTFEMSTALTVSVILAASFGVIQRSLPLD